MHEQPQIGYTILREVLMSSLITLSNGVQLPSIGLGTFEVKDEDALKHAIYTALGVGYRLFDTAQCYKNEHIIGKHMWPLCAEYGIARDEIFLISKVHPANHGYEETEQSIIKYLADLSVDYLDLLLIHWPGTKGVPVNNVELNRTKRLETWRAMADAYRSGRVGAIGVSNYNMSHLEELWTWIGAYDSIDPVFPVVNQIEVHPGWYPSDVIRWCQQRGVVVQGYSSIGRARTLLKDPCIASIADELGVSRAAVCLMYSRYFNIPIIPKSINADHILENWRTMSGSFHPEDPGVFSEMHVTRIRENVPQCKVCWDPSVVL